MCRLANVGLCFIMGVMFALSIALPLPGTEAGHDGQTEVIRPLYILEDEKEGKD